MANAIQVRVPRISFCLTIPNTSTMKKVSSPTFSLQGAQWKVEACKECNKKTKQEFLSFYLFCTIEQQPNIRAASGSLKLLSWDEHTADSSLRYVTNVFDENKSGFLFSPSIEWRDLFAEKTKYVQNDTINVEIQLEVPDPTDNRRSTFVLEKIGQCCEMTTLELKVTIIINLIAVRSPRFTQQNLDYNLIVYKNTVDQFGFLLGSSNNTSFKSQAKISIEIKQPQYTDTHTSRGTAA